MGSGGSCREQPSSGGRERGVGFIWFPFSGGRRTRAPASSQARGFSPPLPGPPGPALRLEVRVSHGSWHPGPLLSSGSLEASKPMSLPEKGTRTKEGPGDAGEGSLEEEGSAPSVAPFLTFSQPDPTISPSVPSSKPPLLPDFTPLSLSFHTWNLGIIIVPPPLGGSQDSMTFYVRNSE